jgi:hypothetical protein
MVQALAGIALLQLAQIQAGTEVLALAVDDGGAHAGRQRLELVAQGEHQGVVERIAFGSTGEADDGDLLLFALQFKVEVWVADGGFQMPELWL